MFLNSIFYVLAIVVSAQAYMHGDKVEKMPLESFVYQKHRESQAESEQRFYSLDPNNTQNNQDYYNYEEYDNSDSASIDKMVPTSGDDEHNHSLQERSQSGKFLLLKGEIHDDGSDDSDLKLIEKLLPTKERIFQSYPVFPPGFSMDNDDEPNIASSSGFFNSMGRPNMGMMGMGSSGMRPFMYPTNMMNNQMDASASEMMNNRMGSFPSAMMNNKFGSPSEMMNNQMGSFPSDMLNNKFGSTSEMMSNQMGSFPSDNNRFGSPSEMMNNRFDSFPSEMMTNQMVPTSSEILNNRMDEASLGMMNNGVGASSSSDMMTNNRMGSGSMELVPQMNSMSNFPQINSIIVEDQPNQMKSPKWFVDESSPLSQQEIVFQGGNSMMNQGQQQQSSNMQNQQQDNNNYRMENDNNNVEYKLMPQYSTESSNIVKLIQGQENTGKESEGFATLRLGPSNSMQTEEIAFLQPGMIQNQESPNSKQFNDQMNINGRPGSRRPAFMVEFAPQPEPAGCHCDIKYMKETWPREKRCVKRCAMHHMINQQNTQAKRHGDNDES